MYRIVRPTLFKQDPEQMHNFVSKGLSFVGNSFLKYPVKSFYSYNNEKLNSEINGLKFENPIGLAAGFDKNANFAEGLSCLGFGFVEIGSVTYEPNEGNEKPRIFRLVEDEAAINRTGLNNEGSIKVNQKLQKINSKIIIGVNIAKTNREDLLNDKAIEDICNCYKTIRGGDYIAINISCPNTKDGKTFEETNSLESLLREIKKLRLYDKRPMLIKISPDLEYKTLDNLLEITENCGINGYILTNTTKLRENLKTSREKLEKIGKGGLSGKPLKEKSTDIIKYVYKHLNSPFIIGSGGIFNAYDAYEKIKAGASLIQIYTGMIYEGPGIVKNIKKALVDLIEKDGINSIKEAVGIGTK